MKVRITSPGQIIPDELSPKRDHIQQDQGQGHAQGHSQGQEVTVQIDTVSS